MVWRLPFEGATLAPITSTSTSRALGALAALVSQKPDPRVPWPDALRVLDFIAANLPPAQPPSAQLPKCCRAAVPSANPLGRAALG